MSRKFCISCRSSQPEEGFKPFFTKEGYKRGSKCASCWSKKAGSASALTQQAKDKACARLAQRQVAPTAGGKGRFKLEHFQTGEDKQ